MVGFSNMGCWWCLINFVMFVVVCRWSLSHDNLCLTVLVALNWLHNGMLISDDATVWWFVFGLVICDGFNIWFSDWLNGTMIHIQLSLFWDLYTGLIRGKQVHKKVMIHNSSIYLLTYVWSRFAVIGYGFYDEPYMVWYSFEWFFIGFI